MRVGRREGGERGGVMRVGRREGGEREEREKE